MRKSILATIAGLCMAIAVMTNICEAQTMNTALSSKQQAIIPVAAFTARGDMPNLTKSLNEGLDNGLSINEIKQVLVQMYAYCGFPRSLNALASFSEVLKERETKGIKDETGKEAAPFPPAGKTSLELGTETQTKLVGAPVQGGLMDFAPDIDEYLKAHLFGDIFGRDNLDWQSREIATVAALAAMDGTGAQLRSHYAISLNIGISEAQLKNLVTVLENKVGKQIGVDAGKILTETLRSR